jgi:hypothetical protein
VINAFGGILHETDLDKKKIITSGLFIANVGILFYQHLELMLELAKWF